MGNELRKLQPQALWSYFDALCAVPRPSKMEDKAVAFVRDFAITQGLDYTVDSVGNVIIRKPASPGMEKRTGVILQAHLDMVPQKNNDIQHDFEKDPINAFVDGDWVRAKGTTLGADNGIGVAAMLAVLESKDIAHGPLEALFTVDEETGGTGAIALQAGLLKGSVLINLDTEEEGVLYIGCAGGIFATTSFPYVAEPSEKDSIGFKINLTGLKGGHSGLDINLGRGNANKLLNRFLWTAARDYGVRVSSVEGGDMSSAIPREASAIVAVPASKVDDWKKTVVDFQTTISLELNGVESDISFTAGQVERPVTVMSRQSQDNILNAIYAVPNGVYRMIAEFPEVVETSTNLGIVKSDNQQVEIICLLLSSTASVKEDLTNAIVATCKLAGATTILDGSFPEWEPNLHSGILKTMKDVYQNLYGSPATVQVIHGGLECAIFKGSYPDIDSISFGPTIESPHSPEERVNIPSVARFWDYLIETLKNV